VTLSIPTVELAGIDVLAAGAVLWRPGPAGAELALVHRPRYDDWAFPKGKLERDEAMPFAAVREVAEETGFGCRLGTLLGDIRYPVAEGSKLVRYWAAEARSGGFEPNHETDELRWLSPGAAADLLTYPHDRALLRRFTELAPPRSVVLLVRHAKAGSRDQWDGDDAQRPLSESGRAQAEQLGRLLPLFGPDRLAGAPLRRCRETMQPAAERLGLATSEEPLLSETAYQDDPDAAVNRVRELAEQPGVTAVNSQGRVIPHLVRALLDGRRLAGVDPDDLPSRKASTWVLTFGDDGLRSADYYPEPTGA
jgi:8-oxo-dGTP diphosphatase